MPTTYSPNLRVSIIGTGDQAGVWGDTTNTNIGTLLEGAISGYTSISVTSANQAFTANNGSADQARMAIVRLTTTTVAAFNVYAPNTPKVYLIWNDTAYTATIYPAAANTVVATGTGYTIAAGAKQIVWTDGATGFYSVSSPPLTATANFSMGGFKITNLGAPTTSGDALAYGTSLGPITATTASFSGDITGTIGLTTPSGSKFTFAHTAPVVVTFSATAMVFNCALSNVFTVAMTANVTVAPTYTNPKDGQTINIFLTQDATGSRTITWGSSVKIAGGATQGVLSTAANSVDLAVLTYRSATTFWYLTLAKAFA
jgi:hypothetical protein